MVYSIEHYIRTISSNAVMKDGDPAGFEIEGIRLTHRDFNYRDGWKGSIWVADGEFEADRGIDAINNFRAKLGRIAPRVALISQSYIEYFNEPWLMRRGDEDVVLYRHMRDLQGGGLMFMEEELKALKKLLVSAEVPEEFYLYWNDAVNSVGYPAKLLLMFSAIESLVKKPNGKKDWVKVEGILGSDLKKDLYGEIGNTATGLRHRLTHGEYFSEHDVGKDYLVLVHRQVLKYFNEKILNEDILALDVVAPQRHPFGNKEEGFVFLKEKQPIDIRYILETFGSMGPDTDENYEIVYPDNSFRTSF
jgi:hypothetical protein